jgi:Tol biopolymer transport system component/tRNA A-37 threonylcarbamoyl transferase component Bud32
MSEVEALTSSLAGRYTIVAEVGAGGMATVYRARDIKHDRQVAIKVLRPELGAVLGVERFLSEIRVTANLQHPNVLPLFDSGEASGLLYYVMPYVEGETLRHRLDREKQLPIDDAVRISAAVGNALGYAHEHGVIHRDLKPENILLQHGEPVIADFGIALAVSNAGGQRVTQTGLSLGTPQYMSPEQATGDGAIDGRTDIYSLGALTYEMLTGDPPHVGSTAQAIIARVLTERPRSVRVSRPSVPAHVDGAVERAIEKLPADRFATARGFVDALTGKVMVSPTTAVVTAVASRSRRESILMATLGVVAMFWAATGWVAAHRVPVTAAAPLGRFDIATQFAPGQLQVSVSPDGRIVAFSGRSSDNVPVVYARSLDATEATPILATKGATFVFWSPDGRQVAFTTGSELKRVTLAGGAAETICAISARVRDGTWNDRNTIVFTDNAVYRVPATGGAPAKIDITGVPNARWQHPVFLPDGDHFLVLNRAAADKSAGLYIASLGGGMPVKVSDVQTRVAFVAPNYLLFVRDQTLYAQVFDWRAGRLSGEPIRLADDVGVNIANGNSGFGVSVNGVLALRSQSVVNERQLQWYSRSGAPMDPLGDAANYVEIALSPDEKRVATTFISNSRIGLQNVWVTETATNIRSQLTFDTAGVSGLLWSADSRSVVYRSLSHSVHIKAIGSSTDSTLYSSPAGPIYLEDLSRDGKTLLLHRPDTLLALSLSGGAKPIMLARLKAVDEVRFSPDGKQISYSSDESGVFQIYVASYPAMDNRRQISANGGMQARWRADGKELFFLSPEGKVMVAAAQPGGNVFSAPTVLFQSPIPNPAVVSDQWDVARDGQRFLFSKRADQDKGGDVVAKLTIVMNWQTLLPKQ